MLIDASLGTASCGGAVMPEQTPASQRFRPPAEPDDLTIQMNVTQTAIASGAALPLAGSVRQIGDGLSYDAANHAVVVNETGVYFFNWNVLVQAAEETTDVVIALQSLDGTVLLATSGAPAVTADDAVLISGSAIARLRAGTAWALVNVSGAAISVPVAGTAPAAFAASLNVAEISQQ